MMDGWMDGGEVAPIRSSPMLMPNVYSGSLRLVSLPALLAGKGKGEARMRWQA